MRSVRSWPLLVLAAPAAAEVFSGWVGIAQKTGFGPVSPPPGIWPAPHQDTAITLPVDVKANAAYALRAWLTGDQAISARTRRFASAGPCSLELLHWATEQLKAGSTGSEVGGRQHAE